MLSCLGSGCTALGVGFSGPTGRRLGADAVRRDARRLAKVASRMRQKMLKHAGVAGGSVAS
eukprot:7625695-Prorocentrum_lima.AAC.1